MGLRRISNMAKIMATFMIVQGIDWNSRLDQIKLAVTSEKVNNRADRRIFFIFEFYGFLILYQQTQL